MKTNAKRFKRICLGVIILLIIGIIAFMFHETKKENKTNINLEDESFISRKLKECDYTILRLNIKSKSFGAPINFYNYKTNYINVKIGKNFEMTYKNVMKSILIEDVEKASLDVIEKEVNAYKEKALEFLNYSTDRNMSEFDRNKDIEKEVDITKTTYENLKTGETIHYISLFDEKINYDIAIYVENNQLIGEISYDASTRYNQVIEENDEQEQTTQNFTGVGLKKLTKI